MIGCTCVSVQQEPLKWSICRCCGLLRSPHQRKVTMVKAVHLTSGKSTDNYGCSVSDVLVKHVPAGLA